MHAQLVPDDVGFMGSYGYAAEPFLANIVVAFAYLHGVTRTALSQICEVMKQTDIEGGLDGWNAADAIVIEAREKAVVEAALNKFRNDNLASLDATTSWLNSEL